ncbi:MAG TPA: glycosyltransferase family 39 protein, partial [Candidatus Fermentibacter sp.]|nr:glycosyltransferase family 39 protein [Candidatus Fermentibacter sp.]
MADRTVGLTVAAAVVAVRIAFMAYLGGALAEPARDQELYLRLAGSILDGKGLSFGSDENMLRVERSGDEGISGSWASDPRYVFGIGPVEEPSALVEPGYPMILAACMAVAGRVSGAVFLPNLLAQIVGALAVSEIARRLAGSRGAMLAGLSFAFYPYYV